MNFSTSQYCINKSPNPIVTWKLFNNLSRSHVVNKYNNGPKWSSSLLTNRKSFLMKDIIAFELCYCQYWTTFKKRRAADQISPYLFQTKLTIAGLYNERRRSFTFNCLIGFEGVLRMILQKDWNNAHILQEANVNESSWK